ncbi:MAG: TIGR02147 family protein [Chitinispirillaceae bacterium]|nr:TIGR02147 family protein [Chitinispirillaceae bacterium]
MAVIFNYFDYREYLKDDLAKRKGRSPGFSLRSMAAKLDISSSTLIRIFNGKRNISENLLPKFISFLGFRSKEAEYFTHLVHFCQSRSERLRLKEYNALVQLRSEKTKTVSDAEHALYDEWYFSAVRELLRIYPFDGDYQALSRMLEPPITMHEAKRAVRLLVRLGFVKRNGKSYTVQDHTITTGAVWHGTAVQRFHRDTLIKAVEGIERIPRSERDYSTMTMCYSAEGYKQVRELLKRTREELSRIEEQDANRNRVYQINLQLFPLSQPYERDTR